MKIILFAYSRQGCRTARCISAILGPAEIYTVERLAAEGFRPIPKPSRDFYGEQFARADCLIFVGSCGIAVRNIAPHVRSKAADPAVLCVDELGSFVISLLSGHMGGANRLAKRVAEGLKATPVITTATDINHRFSVDGWAAEQGFALSSLQAAKAVSARILEQDIPLCSDFPIHPPLPNGIVMGNSGQVGICLSCHTREPFATTLRLVPRILHLGIGCKKGTEADTIERAVQAVLEEHRLDRRAISTVASIDLKAEEEGLLRFCRANGWGVTFYSPGELSRVEGEFTPSAFVRSVTGVDNVCERSALMGADRLIVKKTALNGVTVALAAEKLEVSFE